MSEVVINWTTDILTKGLKNFASENKEALVRPSDVKIIIGISDITTTEPSKQNPIKRTKGEPFYRVFKKDQPYMRERKIGGGDKVKTDEVSFVQILGSMLDMFQIESMTKPVLIQAFERFAEEENTAMLNDEGFKAYIEECKANVSKEGKTEEKYQEDLRETELQAIEQNKIYPKDLEIMIVTPKRAELPNVSPDKQDEPIMPVPFLLIGDKKRQLSIAKDIFQQED